MTPKVHAVEEAGSVYGHLGFRERKRGERRDMRRTGHCDRGDDRDEKKRHGRGCRGQMMIVFLLRALQGERMEKGKGKHSKASTWVKGVADSLDFRGRREEKF